MIASTSTVYGASSSVFLRRMICTSATTDEEGGMEEMEKKIQDIHWLIHDSGIRQTDIAEETGISKATISRLKSGRRQIEEMKFENVIKLDKLATKKI